MATSWGAWDAAGRHATTSRDHATDEALPPEHVADLIAWIAAAPPDLVLTQVTVTPLHEQDWP